MPKVVITAQVEDVAKWEKGFRSHGSIFRSQTVTKIDFATTRGSEVALCAEPDDLATFMRIMDSPAVKEAMASDGVKAETVKMFVLDKDVKV